MKKLICLMLVLLVSVVQAEDFGPYTLPAAVGVEKDTVDLKELIYQLGGRSAVGKFLWIQTTTDLAAPMNEAAVVQKYSATTGECIVDTGSSAAEGFSANVTAGDVVWLMDIPPSTATVRKAIVETNWKQQSVTTGLQSVDSTWSSVATHELFTITGDIEYIITITCDVSFTGADSLTFLFEGLTPFCAIEKVDADAGEILSYVTLPAANAAFVRYEVDPTVKITPVLSGSATAVVAQFHGIVTSGLDFGYEIEVASAPAGQLTANIKWRPLNIGTPATVTAGAGGSL